MRSGFEHDVLQNSALAALAIHSATLQHYVSTSRERGVAIAPLMLVLPIVMHEPSRTTIANKVMDGSFYKSVSEDRMIAVGLQHRMQAMARQSFEAINLACAADLIGPAGDQPSRCILIPRRLTEPQKPTDPETKAIIGASKRVGHWLATVRFPTLCSVLNVRF